LLYPAYVSEFVMSYHEEVKTNTTSGSGTVPQDEIHNPAGSTSLEMAAERSDHELEI
jgi:hypothetical protein